MFRFRWNVKKFFDQAVEIVDSYRLRALRRRQRPLRVNLDGSSYYLNPEPTALYHARNSMPKLSRMVELIEDAQSILDIGANCGVFAAMCAMRFPGATIHAFEPSAALQPTLALNCTAPNVSVHQLAVGDRNGTDTLYIHPGSQQVNSLQPSAVEAFLPADEIDTQATRCVTVDSFIAHHAIDPVDVLKVDVQGWEGAVLRGARHALGSVRYLFLEATWLDPAGMQGVLPAAMHHGFKYAAVVNSVYAGADLLFTREPLATQMPNVQQFQLGDEATGMSWI